MWTCRRIFEAYCLQTADAIVFDCYLAASYCSQTNLVDEVAVTSVIGFASPFVKDSAYSDRHLFRSFGVQSREERFLTIGRC